MAMTVVQVREEEHVNSGGSGGNGEMWPISGYSMVIEPANPLIQQ